jgi:hypothetical protein
MNIEVAKILAIKEMVHHVTEATGSISSFGVGNYSPSPVESLIRANAVKAVCAQVWGWADETFSEFMHANGLVWNVASNAKIPYEALVTGKMGIALVQAQEWISAHLNAAYETGGPV